MGFEVDVVVVVVDEGVDKSSLEGIEEDRCVDVVGSMLDHFACSSESHCSLHIRGKLVRDEDEDRNKVYLEEGSLEDAFLVKGCLEEGCLGEEFLEEQGTLRRPASD